MEKTYLLNSMRVADVWQLVVDEDMRLIGEVNMYEVIAGYLRARER